MCCSGLEHLLALSLAFLILLPLGKDLVTTLAKFKSLSVCSPPSLFVFSLQLFLSELLIAAQCTVMDVRERSVNRAVVRMLALVLTVARLTKIWRLLVCIRIGL